MRKAPTAPKPAGYPAAQPVEQSAPTEPSIAVTGGASGQTWHTAQAPASAVAAQPPASHPAAPRTTRPTAHSLHAAATAHAPDQPMPRSPGALRVDTTPPAFGTDHPKRQPAERKARRCRPYRGAKRWKSWEQVMRGHRTSTRTGNGRKYVAAPHSGTTFSSGALNARTPTQSSGPVTKNSRKAGREHEDMNPLRVDSCANQPPSCISKIPQPCAVEHAGQNSSKSPSSSTRKPMASTNRTTEPPMCMARFCRSYDTFENSAPARNW